MHIPDGFIWDLDRKLLLVLNGDWGGGWDTFWWTVTQPWCWAPLYVAMIALLWRHFGWRRMLVAVGLIILALALADQTANFFKNNTPKFRPTYTDLEWLGMQFRDWVHTVRDYTGLEYRGGRFGTVSGHAATSMAIALTAAGIYRRWWFSVGVALYVVLTAYSRIYLGVHFPLDILFGLSAGTLIGLFALWLWRLIDRRWGWKMMARRS
ncbi:MAG: phosphatase PAP2 family protein [Alistipes sp.]|jgi:undecaprenyl-diphosphatase|nr:phosphatase PAP2 family protein [Alistipes sp.]